jgi:hypothetical protein
MGNANWQHDRSGRRALWLAIGVLGGLAASAIWPQAPLHAVATDRYENFAIATGPLDGDVEAVYIFDFLTGDLMGAALSTQTYRFNAYYRRNILDDLGIDQSTNPRYLMVTGMAELRRGGGQRARPGLSVIYIAELTTGQIAVYGVRWSPEMHNRGQTSTDEFVLLDVQQFRTAALRDEGGNE